MPEEIAFYCPYCLRVERHSIISTMCPNTICQHYIKGKQFNAQMIPLDKKELPETLEEVMS